MKTTLQTVLILSSILTSSTNNLSIFKKAFTQKESSTRKALSLDEERSLFCSSIEDAFNGSATQVFDEWDFDHHIPGKTRFLEKATSRWITAGRTFTLGVKLDRSSINSVLNKTITLSAAILLNSHGPSIKEEYNQTVKIVEKLNLKLASSSNSCIKEINYADGAFYLTCIISENSTLSELSFTFGTQATTFNKIQVSPGNYTSFPGFKSEYISPCKTPTNKLTDDIYIDISYNDLKKDTINLLLNSTLAYDYEDEKYILPKLEKDDYTTNKENVGEYYPVVISASDNEGNKTIHTFYLRTVDNIPPTILKKSKDKISMSYADLSESALLDLFNVADNHQLKSVSIVDLDFEELKHKIGTFDFRVEAIDMSDNVEYKSDSVTLLDDVSPLITAPLRINTTVSKVLSLEEIKSLITVYDEIDGDDIKVTIDYKSYKENATKKGSYSITITAQDKSNNISQKTIPVTVSDDKGPAFFIYEYQIKIFVGEIVDVLKVINNMAEEGLIKQGKYISYDIISGDDLSNPLSAGNYKAKILAKTDDGESILVNLNLVIEEKITPQKKNKTIWQKIISFFNTIFTNIGNFFKHLFK